MPPGAKKRKAAAAKKKKKQNNNNNNNNNNPTHENDERRRSQDEKSSDGGSSPASRDNDSNSHPFHDHSQQGLDTSTQNDSVDQFVSKKELMDISTTANFEKEMNSEEDVDIKEIDIANEINGKDGTFDTNGSNYVPQVDDHNKLAEKAISYESSTDSYVDDEIKPTAQVITVTESPKPDGNIIVGPGSVVDEVNSAIPVYEEAAEVIKNVSIENSVVKNESGSAFNGISEIPLPTSNESIEFLQPSEMKVKNLPVLEENFGITSSLGESAISTNERTAFTSSEGPSAVTNRATENIKDSETEPLIALPSAPAQQVVRKTSWLNCCGIFDVLTGSQ